MNMRSLAPRRIIGLLVCVTAAWTAGAATDPATALSDAQLQKLTQILKYSNLTDYRSPAKSDAVIALGLFGDERAVPVLVEYLSNEPNQNLRMQIAKALGWIGSETAVPALEHALTDPYVHTRQQAAFALKSITGRDYDFDRTGLPQRPDWMKAMPTPLGASPR